MRKINDVKYSNEPMSDKKREQIKYSHTEGLFKDLDYSEFKNKPHPDNESATAYAELMELKALPFDSDFVTKYHDIEGVFEEVCNAHNVAYPSELVSELISSSKGIILELKKHYNRARPNQLASLYGLDLGGLGLEYMRTASYPSKHATQGYLIGKVLQDKIDANGDAFITAGKKISYSRNAAKAHFPSDTKFGEELAEVMFNHLKGKI